jgi:hypothetical protein
MPGTDLNPIARGRDLAIHPGGGRGPRSAALSPEKSGSNRLPGLRQKKTRVSEGDAQDEGRNAADHDNSRQKESLSPELGGEGFG